MSLSPELSFKHLKHYLIECKQSSMLQLCEYFNESPDNLYPLLQHFIQKNQLQEIKLTPKCGTSCQLCDPLNTLKFKWLNDD